MLQNKDRFCLIWFDTELSLERNIRIQNNLRSLIDALFVFKDLPHMESKIQRLKDHKVFFIFYGNTDKQLIKRVHRRAQVAAIYVYCKKPHWEEHLRPLFPKVSYYRIP